MNTTAAMINKITAINGNSSLVSGFSTTSESSACFVSDAISSSDFVESSVSVVSVVACCSDESVFCFSVDGAGVFEEVLLPDDFVGVSLGAGVVFAGSCFTVSLGSSIFASGNPRY